MKNLFCVTGILIFLFLLSCKQANSEESQIKDKTVYQKKVLPNNFNYSHEKNEPLHFSMNYVYPPVYMSMTKSSDNDVPPKEKISILNKAGGSKKIESYKLYLERNSDEDLNQYLKENVHLTDLNNDGLKDIVIYSHPMSLASLEIFLNDKNGFYKILSYTGGYAEIKFDFIIGNTNYLIVNDSESGGGLFSYTTIYEVSDKKTIMTERRVYNSDTVFPKEFNTYAKTETVIDSDIWSVYDKKIIEGEEKDFYRSASIPSGTVCYILNSHKENGINWLFCLFRYSTEHFNELNKHQGFTGSTYYYGWIKSENIKKY